MRYLFFISPMFNEWPLAIARELLRRDGSSEFTGIVAGKKRIYRKVLEYADPPIRPLYDLAELERKWLATPVSNEKLNKYERILGNDVLNRIVVSSRHIGHGWVSGAFEAKTRLMALSADSEHIRQYVVGLLDFLFGTFEQYRPDVVFCYTVAEAPAYGLAVVSKHLGVSFREQTHSRIGTQCLFDDAAGGLFGPVRRTYEKALRDPAEVAPFLPEARNYLRKFRSQPATPEYQQAADRAQKLKRSLFAIPKQTGSVLVAIAKRLIRGPQREWHVPSDWERRSWQLRVNVRALKLSYSKRFHSAGEFPSRPFAYFPLHLDPEASTLVYAPFQTNQLAIIEVLSKALPFGMDLVVKEHPGMVGSRPSGFYDTLQGMPKVFLASAFENTFELSRRADLTCSITGTAAWEAMMLGKPVLIVGENFPYLGVGQGAEHCTDLSRLSVAVAKALKARPADDERLELFIASIFRHSFDWPSELLWSGRISRQQTQDHPEILRNICDRLEAAANGKD